MEREAVLEKLQPLMRTQVRDVTHDASTRIAMDGKKVTFRPGRGAHTLDVTAPGVISMCNFVGLSEKVAGKLTPHTLAIATNELLQKKGNYALMVRDGSVTSVTRPGEYRNCNPSRVLDAIEKSIPNAEYHRVLIKDNVVRLEIAGEKREPVVKGDLVQAGSLVQFSPIGTVNPMVESYVLRLVCTNGLVAPHVLHTYEYGGGGNGGGGGEGDNIWQWFRESIKDAYRSINPIVERYRQMIREAVRAEDRAAMLESMLRQAKISGEAAHAVRAMAMENPPQNTYELLNLITYASSHLIKDADRVARAQEAAAEYVAESAHTRVCPLCHSQRTVQ